MMIGPDRSMLIGMRIIESEYLVEDGNPYEVRRTWRERLFTRPWRPLRATRTVVPKMPLKGAVRLDARTLVMHPATYRELKDMLRRSEEIK
jgi:hypothetical protein